MYYFSGIFILILAVLVILGSRRKKLNICKVSSMPMEEKYNRLNQLIEPFGYCYNNCQDAFSTTLDAWQKDFGYIYAYDKFSPFINLVFDCEPVYFYYDNKTWLIEFWKGQYGINAGGEIGIYYVDYIVPRKKLRKTLFFGVPADEMMPLSMDLCHYNESIVQLSKRHWWLTAFRMGSFCAPKKLTMNISITFPTKEMLEAFVNAMLDIGYRPNDICICGSQVFFTFDRPFTKTGGWFRKLWGKFSLLQDRLLCWLYRVVTRPFCLTVDKLMYMYFYIPFGFRRMIRLKRLRGNKNRKGR